MAQKEDYTKIFLKTAGDYIDLLQKNYLSLIVRIDVKIIESSLVAAHSLKGEALFLKYQVLADNCYELEKLCRSAVSQQPPGWLVNYEKLLKIIQNEYDKIRSEAI